LKPLGVSRRRGIDEKRQRQARRDRAKCRNPAAATGGAQTDHETRASSSPRGKQRAECHDESAFGRIATPVTRNRFELAAKHVRDLARPRKTCAEYPACWEPACTDCRTLF